MAALVLDAEPYAEASAEAGEDAKGLPRRVRDVALSVVVVATEELWVEARRELVLEGAFGLGLGFGRLVPALLLLEEGVDVVVRLLGVRSFGVRGGVGLPGLLGGRRRVVGRSFRGGTLVGVLGEKRRGGEKHRHGEERVSHEPLQAS